MYTFIYFIFVYQIKLINLYRRIVFINLLLIYVFNFEN